MSEEFYQKLKAISEMEFPEGLHGKIMRKLAFLQFRTPFLIVVSLLTLNLLFSGWSIWLKVTATESFSTFSLLLEGFEWNWASTKDLWLLAQDLFPVGLMVSFLINTLLVLYLLVVIKSFRKLSLRKQ